MKLPLLIYTFLICFGIHAQNTILSEYKENVKKTERFTQPLNTGVNHTLLILSTAWESFPEIGDEIAVYDSEKNLVSSVAWRPEQQGHSALSVWGDDEFTEEKDGMFPGEAFSIVLFDKSEELITELKVNAWERGNNVFVKDGLSAISSISLSNEFTPELELFQNVPNPVQDNTSISFYLPQDVNVTLRVTSSLGQDITTLVSSDYSKGMHTIQMDAKSLATGVYFYTLKSYNKIITKQFTKIN